jgi:CelD/BcsL family acetyltransferase involved in cellulose biosynthesis
MLHAEILRPAELGPFDLAEWRDMLAANPALRSPLLGPEFAQAVGAVRRDTFVAVFKRDGRTAGCLAFHRAWDGHARPVGAPFSDYHCLITEPGAGIGLPEALRAAGLRRLRYHSALDPEGVFEASAWERQEAYAIDLQGRSAADYQEALRVRSPKNPRRWRQLMNKLEREAGPVELVGPDPCREALDLALGWKSAQLRRTGLYNVLQPRWSRDLVDNLFAAQGEPFGGMLITLRAAGRPIAAVFGPRQGAAYHTWIAAFDPAFATYRPGRLLHAQALAQMDALGLDLFDMGPTHGHWKKSFVLEPKVTLSGMATAGAPARRLTPEPARGLASGLTRKVAGRLEHIAAAEPTPLGRARALADSAMFGWRRLGGLEEEAAAEA